MFDIDHLYLFGLNYKIGEKELTQEQVIQNNLMELMVKLLADPTSRNISYKSIDNDTSLITDIAKLIPEEQSNTNLAYNLGTLHEQTSRKNDYITGKVGIGPFALNITNHILTTLYGVRFQDSKFTQLTGINGLHKFLDSDDNQISSWLSAYVNAHVDIVKDPYISKLNVNSFTYNTINLLTRNGLGKEGLFFLCQPIIRQMANANIDSNSEFARNPAEYKSRYDMYSKKIDKILPELTGQNINYFDSVVAVGKMKPNEKAFIVNSVLKDNDGMLQKIAINPNLVNTDPSAKQFQMDCYNAWLILQPYAAELNKLIQYTKIDTRKEGKNFIEVEAYLQNYKELKEAKKGETLFDKKSLNDMLYGTWIDEKTEAVRNVIQNVLSIATFQANPEFLHICEEMADTLSPRFMKDAIYLRKQPKALRTISQAVSSNIKVSYFSRLAEALNINIKGLFEGERTMQSRLNSIKYCIDRDAYGLSRLRNNYLLNHLIPHIDNENKYIIAPPKFIEVINGMNEDKQSADMFIESWEDLLRDEDQNVRNFARDLIFYAMFTSGDTKGFNKLAKYVPFSWLETQQHESLPRFSEYIRQALVHPNQFIDKEAIVQNNYMDQTFVSKTTYNNFYYCSPNGETPRVLVQKETNNTEAPMYVAVRNAGSKFNDQRSYKLYKLIGLYNSTPVYGVMPKLGYKAPGGFQIYEYGNIGLSINNNSEQELNYSEAINAIINKLQSIGAVDNLMNDQTRITQLQYLSRLYNVEQEAESVAPQIQQEAESVQQETVNTERIEPSGKSAFGQYVWVSNKYYYKELPQKHPDVQYVFTENVQAYKKSQNLDMSDFRNQNPSLNVSSGRNGTNQACIRTDPTGKANSNAIGICVTLMQQNSEGRWLVDEGCFKDTPRQKEIFRSMINHAIERIDKTKQIVFPASIALDKAALPKSFAEYLAAKLSKEFSLVCTIQRNENYGYDGYGFTIDGVSVKAAEQQVKDYLNHMQQKQLGLTDEETKQGEQYKKECKGGK